MKRICQLQPAGRLFTLAAVLLATGLAPAGHPGGNGRLVGSGSAHADRFASTLQQALQQTLLASQTLGVSQDSHRSSERLAHYAEVSWTTGTTPAIDTASLPRETDHPAPYQTVRVAPLLLRGPPCLS